MKRSQVKKVDATALVVDRNVNFRDDYDLESMMEQIRSAGRVLEPIHALKDSGIVLKGNRRAAAVQQLLSDAKLPSDLKDAISQLDVFWYEDCSPDEITQLVLDHGTQKSLTRVEIVKAVWRLMREMKSERQIICLLYNQFAHFTGQTRKAHEAQQKLGADREEFLKKWLHGTVGNYLMAAYSMGERVRENLLLTELSVDRTLTDEEKKRVEFKVSRERVTKLSKAKNEDKDAAGWTPETGGEKFNALIQEFIDEDAGKDTDKVKRPTPKQMEQAADGMKSSAARIFYQHCAGILPDADKKKLEEVDSEIYRTTKVRDAIVSVLDSIADANVKLLLTAIAYKGENDVTAALKMFVAS